MGGKHENKSSRNRVVKFELDSSNTVKRWAFVISQQSVPETALATHVLCFTHVDGEIANYRKI